MSKDAFIEAAAAWAVSPEINLADRLVGNGVLTEDNRVLVDRLTDEAIKHHQGNEKAAFDSIDGESYTSRILEQDANVGANKKLSTILGLPAFISAPDPEYIRAVEEGAGRYTTRGEHSRGGMGRILVVHDEFLDRDVALKELLPERTGRPLREPGSSGPLRASGALLARFLREAQVTGQLEHPSIVPVYELGRRSDGTLYYTMKLVRGRTFLDALKSAKTLKDRLALLPNFVDLCYAIAYAHSRNVIHRDLKPANVMLGTFGETVVIDWGIAKVTGQEDDYEAKLRDTLRFLSKGEHDRKEELGRTVTGQMIGTPAYMAPEQIDGRIKDIDQRTDVFALGVMLYEILAGTHPFTGKTSAEIMSGVLTGTPTSIDRIEPGVPVELASICEKAMQKASADRFQSAEEMAAEIERFQAGAMVQSYKYSVREVLARNYAKHRPLVNLAAAALFILFIGGLYSYVSIRVARDDAILARDDAEREAYRAQIRVVQSYVHENNYPAARQTLWKTDPALRHWEWSHLLDNAYEEEFSIPDYDRFTLSPDDAVLATYFRELDIKLFNVSDGSELASIPLSADESVRALEFSPDATLLAAIMRNGTAKIWRWENGDIIQSLSVSAETLSFDPTGTRLLTGGGDGVVQLWGVETGEVIRTFQTDGQTISRVQFSNDGGRVWADVNGAIVVWDALSGEELARVVGGFADVSYDAQTIVVPQETDVEVWQVGTATRLQRFTANALGVKRVRLSPQGGRLLTVGIDDTVTIWSLETYAQLVSIPHSVTVMNAVFSPDGSLIVTSANDNRIRVWEAATGLLLNELGGHTAPVVQLVVTQDSTRLLSTAADRTIIAWSPRILSGLQIVATHPSGIRRGVAMSGDGKKIALLSGDYVLAVFDRENGQPFFELATAGDQTNLVADFSPDGERIAVAVDEFLPMVLDATTGEMLSYFAQHEGLVEAVSYAPNGNEVATGSRDGTIRVWDAQSGVERLRLVGHEHSVNAVRFSPNGEFLVTGDYAGLVILWDAETGEERKRLNGHTDLIEAIVWGKGTNQLITCSQDNTIRVWNPVGDDTSVLLEGLRSPPTTAGAPFGDGRYISGSSYSVRVWDSSDNTELIAFSDPSQNATDILAVPGSNQLLVRTASDTIQLWDTYPWTATAQGQAGESAYLAYRDSRSRLVARCELDASPRLIVVTTREVLSVGLNRLLDALASEPANSVGDDAVGLRITGGARRDAVARIQLHENDVVRAIAGNVITDRSSATAALQTAAQLLQDDAELEMTITRRGFEKTVRFVLLSMPVQSRVVPLTRDEASDLLRALSDALAARGFGIASGSRKDAERLGEGSEDSEGVAGIWLGSSPVAEDRQRFQTSQMSPSDRILQVNGTPVESLDTFRTFVNETLAGVERGDVMSYTIHVERGGFSVITFEYEITDL